jgi:hypothetical protein
MLRTRISNAVSGPLLTIALLAMATVCVSTAQVKSQAKSNFVLSSPDA